MSDEKTAPEAQVERFRERLGPELHYLADPLAPAVSELVVDAARAALDEALVPIRTGTDNLLARAVQQDAEAAEQHTQAVMTTFEKAHPDWKDHENAMLT